MLRGWVERRIWANLSASMKYAARSVQEIRGEGRLSDSVWWRRTQSSDWWDAALREVQYFQSSFAFSEGVDLLVVFHFLQIVTLKWERGCRSGGFLFLFQILHLGKQKSLNAVGRPVFSGNSHKKKKKKYHSKQIRWHPNPNGYFWDFIMPVVFKVWGGPSPGASRRDAAAGKTLVEGHGFAFSLYDSSLLKSLS